MSADFFLDTNVLVYACVSNDRRADAARALIAKGGTVSVQVINEFVNVMRRTLRRDWADIEAATAAFRALLDEPHPLSMATHDLALRLGRERRLAFFDALIVAAAVETRCKTLYSEDMQHGLTVEGVTVSNPFAAA